MNRPLFLLVVFIFLTGCSAPMVKMLPGSNEVKVGKSDPADNFKEIGPITASDGKGCGLYGYRGTYDRAVISLKNKASQLGGDYVQIFTLTEPHMRGGCFDNTYTISGSLFRKVSESPSPLPIVETTPQSNIQKLRELKSLLDEGIISKSEFDSQKQRILNEGI